MSNLFSLKSYVVGIQHQVLSFWLEACDGVLRHTFLFGDTRKSSCGMIDEASLYKKQP